MRPKRQRLGDSLTALDRYFREYFADCANAFGLLRIVPDPAFGSCPGMVLFSIPSTVSIANYLAIPWSASSPSTDATCCSTIGTIRASTLSPDGLALYYHARERGKFLISRVTRGASDTRGHQNSCPRR